MVITFLYLGIECFQKVLIACYVIHFQNSEGNTEQRQSRKAKRIEEEALSSCVQQYKALYGKNHRDFHGKYLKNTCNTIAEKLKEEGNAEVEKKFTMLRVKYSRYKQNLNKKEVSSIDVSVLKVKKVREEQN